MGNVFELGHYLDTHEVVLLDESKNVIVVVEGLQNVPNLLVGLEVDEVEKHVESFGLDVFAKERVLVFVVFLYHFEEEENHVVLKGTRVILDQID